MKTTTFGFPFIIIVLALVIPPVAVANLVSLGAGIFLLSSLSSNIAQQWIAPVDTIPVLTQTISSSNESGTIHQLGKGYVIIKNINGKLATRFVRDNTLLG